MGTLFNTKHCATCAYWGGPREADTSCSHARVQKTVDEGLCQNPKSSFKKKSTKANYGGCNKWEKWPALKKMKD